MSLCHCEHYLTHLTLHKAIELAELSRNDKKDHVSQMSMSESSALAEPWPEYVYVCVFTSVQDIWFVQYAGMCILTDLAVSVLLQRRLVTVTAVKSPGHLALIQHYMPGAKMLKLLVHTITVPI